MVNGVLCTEKEIVLDKWKNDFEAIYNIKGKNFDDDFKTNVMREENDRLSDGNINEQINRPIEMDEISKAIKEAKNGKAVGKDAIPNELLKIEEMCMLLHCFFNLCQRHKMIPNIWRKAIIHPIPKDKGFTNDPLNYRGLALQCCIYKILSSIVNARILKHLETNGKLKDEHNGFRHDRSCNHHIFVLTTLLQNRIVQGENTYAAFVDFRKAFDVTNRDLLYHRLNSYCINGPLLNLIKEMYKNTRNQVRINNTLTGEFCSKNGVKQGDNQSATYFCAYINDLIVTLKNTGLGITINKTNMEMGKLVALAYADDIVILSDSCKNLQKLLDVTARWCKKWRVMVNTSKTKLMHFRKKLVPETEKPILFDNVKLDWVKQYRYLGILVSENIDENAIIDQLSRAGLRALGALIGKTENNYDLGTATYSTLFNSQVNVVTDYCSGAWCVNNNCRKINQIMERAIHFHLGLPHTAPIAGYMGDTGWTPGVVWHDLESIRLYNQICKMSAE